MPDGRGAYGSDNRRRILVACEAHWVEHHNNCSGFVKAVAGALGVELTGQANDIFQQVQKAPWHQIGTGASAAQIAGVMAAQDGRFVLAASKGENNGHVAVITDFCHTWGNAKPSNGRPYGYWGSLGAELVAGKNAAQKEYTNNKGEKKLLVFGPYNSISRSWGNLGNVLFAYREL
jgi:hypothetical protein